MKSIYHKQYSEIPVAIYSEILITVPKASHLKKRCNNFIFNNNNNSINNNICNIPNNNNQKNHNNNNCSNNNCNK